MPQRGYIFVFSGRKQDTEHTDELLVHAFRYFGCCVKTVLGDNNKATLLKNNNGKVVVNSGCHGLNYRGLLCMTLQQEWNWPDWRSENLSLLGASGVEKLN